MPSTAQAKQSIKQPAAPAAAAAMSRTGIRVHHTSRHKNSEKLEGQPKLSYTSCTSAVRVVTAAPGDGMCRLVTVRQLAHNKSHKNPSLDSAESGCLLLPETRAFVVRDGVVRLEPLQVLT